MFMELKNFLRITFFGIAIPLFSWWLFPKLGMFLGIWIAIGVVRFLYEFMDWYYDVWLATDVSIVEVMWEGFFEKSSARIEYHTIQGIGYEVKGVLPTVFNYGSIILEKFTGNPSVFDGAISPKKTAAKLTAVQEQFVVNKSFRDHNALQSVLADLVQKHVVEYGLPQEQEIEDN